MKTFDPRAYDLAAIFLGDEPALHTEEKVNELAAHIQYKIEGWIEYERGLAIDNGQFGVGA